MQMWSTLYIINITESDYRTYECWMDARGFYNVDKIFVTIQSRRPAPDPLVIDGVYKLLTIVGGCVVVAAVLLCLVGCTQRRNIRLFLHQRRRIPPSAEGLEFDVVMFHAESSTEINSFDRYLYSRLTAGNERFKPYSVYNANIDILPNESIFRAVHSAVGKARCTLVIICPSFIQDEQCRHWLLNILPLCHIVFVLFHGVTDVILQQLEVSAQVAIRNSRKTVPWVAGKRNDGVETRGERVSEEAGWLMKEGDAAGMDGISDDNWMRVEQKYKRDVKIFWRRLLLAIPNKKLTPTHTGQSTTVT